MAEREATIASRVGLHARPAAIFAEAAGDLPVEVTIAAKGEPADEAIGLRAGPPYSVTYGCGNEHTIRRYPVTEVAGYFVACVSSLRGGRPSRAGRNGLREGDGEFDEEPSHGGVPLASLPC